MISVIDFIEVLFMFVICDGLELLNFVVGMWEENCRRVDLFLVIECVNLVNLFKFIMMKMVMYLGNLYKSLIWILLGLNGINIEGMLKNGKLYYLKLYVFFFNY